MSRSAYLGISPVLLNTCITNETVSSAPLDSVSSDLLRNDGRVPPAHQLKSLIYRGGKRTWPEQLERGKVGLLPTARQLDRATEQHSLPSAWQRCKSTT